MGLSKPKKTPNNNDNGIPVEELWKILLGRLKTVFFVFFFNTKW